MNAFQPSRSPLQPVEPRRRVAPQRKSRHHRRPYRLMALETTAKLAANVVLSVVAATGLVQLLHYQWSHQEKLGEIRTEVKLTQERVNRLQADFSRYFDPQQEKSLMQEQSNWVEPGKLRVVWLDKAAKKADKPAP